MRARRRRRARARTSGVTLDSTYSRAVISGPRSAELDAVTNGARTLTDCGFTRSSASTTGAKRDSPSLALASASSEDESASTKLAWRAFIIGEPLASGEPPDAGSDPPGTLLTPVRASIVAERTAR